MKCFKEVKMQRRERAVKKKATFTFLQKQNCTYYIKLFDDKLNMNNDFNLIDFIRNLSNILNQVNSNIIIQHYVKISSSRIKFSTNTPTNLLKYIDVNRYKQWFNLFPVAYASEKS